MTEEAIFLDSSVFLAFFIDGIDIVENLNGRLITSTNVIEEVAYVLIKEKARLITGIEKHYDLLQHLRENPEVVKRLAEEVSEDIKALLDVWEIVVLPPAGHEDMMNIMLNYGLLPNDALIAATCKHYGIKKIATFDEDFRRVDFLEVVEP